MTVGENNENSQKAKRGRKPIYTHVLFLNLNAKEIYSKLRLEPSFNKVEYSSPMFNPILTFGDKSPLINETSIEFKRQPNCFLENNKFVIMKDHVDYGCMPNTTDLCCWHDKHPFNTSPIGIPIKYIPKTLKIDKADKADKPDKPDDKVDTGENDYFLTIGVFCSFPCCLAYIKEYSKTGNQDLKNSKSLLNNLYFKLYDSELTVNEAPDWRCLKEYGGKLTIDEFRRDFCSCNYIITENIKRPYMVAVGNWVEEKRCGQL